MRRTLTTRVVLVVAVIAGLAAVLFAVLANAPADVPRRTDVILTLDPDIANGRIVYLDLAQPSCASCHELRDAGAESAGALSLDALSPSARAIVESLVGGTVRAHDARGYEHTLTDQQIADLAAYIEGVAGN